MKRIGILGGGQLGMMLCEAKGDLPVDLHFLDPNPRCSVSSLTENLSTGDFKKKDAVLAFGEDKDILTVEIEHVNTEALELLEGQGKKVFPQAHVLKVVQDKGLQKEFYEKHGFPTAPFQLLDNKEQILNSDFGIPCVVKARTGGYDGKGVDVLRSREEISQTLDGKLLLEEMADIEKEISVIVARDEQGDVRVFPPVEMEFDPEANLVSALISPAALPQPVSEACEEIARRLIEELDMVGILAVELFWLKNGEVWVNEIAPRPHNSGHQTIEGNRTSQYEQHIRAIAGLGLESTEAFGISVMVNLLGEKGHRGPKEIQGLDVLEGQDRAYLHDYRKEETRPMRKMGHITVIGEERKKVLKKALELQGQIRYTASS